MHSDSEGWKSVRSDTFIVDLLSLPAHPLTVPSGMQTGIKIDGRWRVDACRSVALHLELEPPALVHLHSPGEGDGWVLNPVIHVAQDPPVLFLGCGGNPVLKE